MLNFLSNGIFVFSKLEVHFYEGRIRVNGNKISKKSVDVRKFDFAKCSSKSV